MQPTSDTIVAPNVRALDQVADRLRPWLGEKLGRQAEVQLGAISYPQGAGRSHETLLVDASWIQNGVRVRQGLVIRIKPTSFTVFPDDLFDQQVRVMQAVHRHGAVRIAETLWREPDPGLLGAPFFVMKRMHGRVPVSTPPYAESGWLYEASVADRRKVWANGVAQLAAIQSVPIAAVSFLAGEDGLSGLDQEWDKYRRYVDWIDPDQRLTALQRSQAALRADWPKNQPAGMVWGDARLGNIMFDERFEVVAVMDWEQPSLGGALHDLAWWIYMSERMHGRTPTRRHFEGMGSRDETIALWAELTGVSTAEIEWYERFAELKLVCTAVRVATLKGWAPPTNDELARRLKV